MDLKQFEDRKRDHIRFALAPENQASGGTGLHRIHLAHDALPELDFDRVRLESVCLGRESRTPFYVAGMTAGHADAPTLNRTIALACQKRGWAMGVGSQRRELEGLREVDHWARLRAEVPDLTLIANLGASQLMGLAHSRVRALIDGMGAQAIVIHLNSLQECIQPEGTPKFAGVVEALRALCAELDVPVVVKETGCGFSEKALMKLKGAGIAAIDVSGLGGTHWGRIEGARASGVDPMRAHAAEVFGDWGESTVDSMLAARKIFPSLELWASGGVRNGLAAGKLIALGASQVGFAKPALEAALEGQEQLERWMEQREFELKVALFCTGTGSPHALRTREGIWKISAN